MPVAVCGDEEEKPQVFVRLELSEEELPSESDIALGARQRCPASRPPAFLREALLGLPHRPISPSPRHNSKFIVG